MYAAAGRVPVLFRTILVQHGDVSQGRERINKWFKACMYACMLIGGGGPGARDQREREERSWTRMSMGMVQFTVGWAHL